MATCARIQHTLGLQRSILSPFSPRVVVSSKPTLRFYTSASQQLNNTSNKATPATAASKFVQNPAFKSTSSLNQSQHSPQFRTQTTQLPNVASRTPLFILAGIFGVAFWAGSIAVAANHQRQGTSIVRGTLFNVKFDTKAQELLGDNIDFVNPSWPWISGTVAHLKGRVDIEFQGANSDNIPPPEYRDLVMILTPN
ncbi:hypothetical protein BGZ97_012589 [Linnemannia gamsii]|uniref:DUF1783-domain-containing protein n=1 Tax=Linnemannia gamsii TaxID=64522 RepID=A0A9P6ULK4_9FUNG|nr:hypothetical protein BGZ97_012589 [Linnemannia gamsii]